MSLHVSSSKSASSNSPEKDGNSYEGTSQTLNWDMRFKDLILFDFAVSYFCSEGASLWIAFSGT